MYRKKTEANRPHPGSPEAVDQGCRCPIIDNGHGKGRGGNGERFGWFMRQDCPLHGWEEELMQQLEADRDSIEVPEDVSRRVLDRLQEEKENA